MENKTLLMDFLTDRWRRRMYVNQSQRWILLRC